MLLSECNGLFKCSRTSVAERVRVRHPRPPRGARPHSVMDYDFDKSGIPKITRMTKTATVAKLVLTRVPMTYFSEGTSLPSMLGNRATVFAAITHGMACRPVRNSEQHQQRPF